VGFKRLTTYIFLRTRRNKSTSVSTKYIPNFISTDEKSTIIFQQTKLYVKNVSYKKNR